MQIALFCQIFMWLTRDDVTTICLKVLTYLSSKNQPSFVIIWVYVNLPTIDA